MAEVQQGTSYDEVPYESQAFHETHPDTLATLAILSGRNPPALAAARVLELGCAGGGNLIPMGLAIPGGTFLGIDLSSRQVADGQAIIRDLGLGNVELRAGSIADVGEDLGPFDYIICHGVYSWVPGPIQAKILEICARRLAPEGVAFISYNVYPGWYVSAQLRAMMLYHAGSIADPSQKVGEARAFLDRLVQAFPEPHAPYAMGLRQEVERLRTQTDAYLLHEHLEEVNHPVYFHEFAARAAEAGLLHIADARHWTMASAQPQPVRTMLDTLSDDPVRREQYLDFLRNRMFRRSVLVRSDVPSPGPSREGFDRLLAAAAAGPVSTSPQVHSNATEEFRTPDGKNRLATNNPVLKAAMMSLVAIWPRALPIPTLRERVAAMLGKPTVPDPAPFDASPEALDAALQQCFVTRLVELHAFEPSFAAVPPDRPEASPWARLQAKTSRRVTNLRHRIVELGGFDQLVLSHLDGTRDRPAVVDALASAVGRGEFPIHRDGKPIGDPAEIRAILDRSLPPSMQRIAGSALLMS